MRLHPTPMLFSWTSSSVRFHQSQLTAQGTMLYFSKDRGLAGRFLRPVCGGQIDEANLGS